MRWHMPETQALMKLKQEDCCKVKSRLVCFTQQGLERGVGEGRKERKEGEYWLVLFVFCFCQVDTNWVIWKEEMEKCLHQTGL